MDGTVLVESNAAVEVACSAQQVEATSLAIVALVCLVDIGSRDDENLGAKRIPLDLGSLCLEEGLLARRKAVECREAVNLDTGRLSLNAI